MDDIFVEPSSLGSLVDFYSWDKSPYKLERFGIYPVVMQILNHELGPLRSDIHVNYSATKVWAKLGAYFDGKRWVLD